MYTFTSGEPRQGWIGHPLSAGAGALAAAPRHGVFRLLASQKRTAATEYAVLTAIIAIGVLMAMGGFDDSLTGIYPAIASVVDSMT